MHILGIADAFFGTWFGFLSYVTTTIRNRLRGIYMIAAGLVEFFCNLICSQSMHIRSKSNLRNYGVVYLLLEIICTVVFRSFV